MPGGLPSAAAVVLESENRQPVPPDAGNLVKIVAPKTEVPVGLLRIGCEVKPPVSRVEFWLDDRKVLVKNRAPYEVELDLGKVPKKQTLKAVGFDAHGNFVDADAWAINEKDARLSVRLLELPKSKSAGDLVEVKVSVQSMAGGMATKLELWLDDHKVKEWARPPLRRHGSHGRDPEGDAHARDGDGRGRQGVHGPQAPQGRVAVHVEDGGRPRRAAGLRLRRRRAVS